MLVAALVAAAGASSHSGFAKPHPATCDGKSVKSHVHRARALFEKAYDPAEAKPDREVIEKAQRHRRCVDLDNVREGLSEFRDEVKTEHKLLHLQYVSTPYPGPGGSRWALPYSIVVCESGADYHVGFAGAYGLLVATWQQWGGPAISGGVSEAGSAAPIYQDIIAHRVWTDVGPSGWECKA